MRQCHLLPFLGGAALIALAAASPAPAAPTGICERVADAAALDRALEPASMPHRPVRMAQADAAKPEGEASAPEADAAKSEADLTKELAAMLQACSYDGKPLEISTAALATAQGSEGEAAVGTIMRFTGLPQNFRVVEGDVPNAAAMILIGPDSLPQRVIAYNKGFMAKVAEATKGGDWPSVSIMAHEIGHHLSGHTLMPGGSQPPLELEADKFSGFVLQKMGAALGDAQKAISTLVPERDGPTHPGRPKRLAAVESGWTESCTQAGGDCAAGTAVAAAEPPPVPAAPTITAPEQTAALPKIPGPADIRMPGSHPASGGDAVIPPEALDTVPRLDRAATPGKFDRFVYDEVGIFHPDIKRELADRAYAYAGANNVEIVTIVARDLQGRSADDYALDAMRQLRVGKLETGNGAVLVVAPGQSEVGVALGAGLAILYDSPDQLKNYLRNYLKVVAGGGRPQVASDLVVDASSRIMRDSQGLEWLVRYPDLAALEAAGAAYAEERQRTGAAFDPTKDPSFRKLARVRATLVSAAPDKSDVRLAVNAVKERHSGPAVQVRMTDGRDAILYVAPSVRALMPTALTEGGEYSFVVRDTILESTTPQLDLVSYDLLR